jgi:cob(I)alamin adenosyltransferase
MTASLPVPMPTRRPSLAPTGVTPAALPQSPPPAAAAHRPSPATGASAPAAHLRLVPQPEGLLQIHTAPFRGSFATVLSQALRTAGLGSRVLVCQFLKGGVDQGTGASAWLNGRLRWLRPAVPACLAEPAADHPGAVLDAVAELWDFSREQLLSDAVDLMVLDELGLAMELGYLDAAAVLETLERRPPRMDVILTGPAMAPELMAMADQVTQLRRGL